MYKPLKVAVICCVYGFGVMFTLPAIAKTYELANGEKINDPTKPAYWGASSAAGGKKVSYKLNYILNADERKQAIINGQTVTEGDVVAGARVVQIGESSVVISASGKRQTLRVNKKRSGIKRTAE